MQGRASKASKKELVIQSPQQFKGSAEVEAEAATQVVVSHSPALFLRSFDLSALSLPA